jgi:hypothetical protein
MDRMKLLGLDQLEIESFFLKAVEDVQEESVVGRLSLPLVGPEVIPVIEDGFANGFELLPLGLSLLITKMRPSKMVHLLFKDLNHR